MNEENKQTFMNRHFRTIIIISIILLIISMVIHYSYVDENNVPLEKPTTFGESLDDKGWMLYVADGCPACEAQKEIIGRGIIGLKVHDCHASIENNKVCIEQGILVIPTWYNVYSNETYSGVRQRLELEEMAGWNEI